MSFENKPTQELIRIAQAGLGFALHQNSKPVEEIHEIIKAAYESGAIITLIKDFEISNDEKVRRFK